MTHALAAIPLTFDSTDLQPSDLSFFLEVTQGLNELPDVRGKDVVIPYLTGQSARNRRADTRRIVLTGFVRGIGDTQSARRTSYRNSMQSLAALFSPTKLPATLTATLEDTDIATIDVRALNMLVNERVPSEYADVSVELLSIDPEWSVVAAGS